MNSFPSTETLSHDQRLTQLLELARVPGWQNLYTLGCFARYVTIYSQQVRALNLVHALCSSMTLPDTGRVAVIGGGIAGVTAAAGLAVRGVKVDIYEERDLFWLQRNCAKRVVHPYIYDWPFNQGKDNRTNLPFLNWSARPANDVAQELENCWKELRRDSEVDARISIHKAAVTGNWLRPEGGSVLLHPPKAKPERFSAVILAVGFGFDGELSEKALTKSYWYEQDFEKARGEWLVSGFGDGAVTDLMRLCIKNFNHADVIRSFEKSTLDPNEVKKLAATSDTQDLSAKFEQLANGLEPEGIELRTDTRVRVNCTEQQLFSSKSSILNRVIVAYLRRHNAFEPIKKPGKISSAVPAKGGRIRVRFEDRRSPLEVDGALLRHGPKSVLEAKFPAIYQACVPVLERWRSAPQGADWTAQPQFELEHFKRDSRPPLRVDFTGRVGCFLLHQGISRPSQSLPSLLTSALLRARDRISHMSGGEVVKEPIESDIAGALSDTGNFLRTVRALCESDLVVIDVTGYNCAAMLFLGIRAVSRRGVTVTVRHDVGEETRFSDQPFNLFELNPMALRGKDAVVIDQLTQALCNGSEQLALLPNFYLDLPVYDAVRRLGPKLTAYANIPAEQEGMILSWFNDAYWNRGGQRIMTLLKDKYHESDISRVIDTTSPQLVGQRLYERIRRCNLCAVDWTGWRPNVFFELGVRLAINPVEPLMFVHATDWPAKHSAASGREKSGYANRRKWHDLLTDLLQPVVYGDQSNSSAREDDPIWRAVNTQIPVRKKLSRGAVYRVMRGSTAAAKEPWGQPVEKELEASADALIGADAFEQTSPNLYCEEDDIRRRVRKAAIDRLLAAWLFLDHRWQLSNGKLHAKEIPEATVRVIRHVGRRLGSAYANSTAPEEQRIAKQVTRALRQVRGLVGTDPIDRVWELKSKAIELRQRKAYGASIAKLEEARAELEDSPATNKTAAGRKDNWERDTATELANVYGSMGGTYRSAGKWKEAIDCYDKGHRIESDDRNGIEASYNLLQRLITRIHYNRKWIVKPNLTIMGEQFPQALESARKTIEAQLRERRAGDEWAMADHVMVCLLLNADDGVSLAHELRRKVADTNVFTKTGETIKELRRALQPHARRANSEDAKVLLARMQEAQRALT